MEKIHELAFKALLEKFRKDGLWLRPKTIKRDLHNFSKKLGVEPSQAKELFREIIQTLHCEVMREIEGV